ncbi:MAG TPA: DNA polymerase Y family protein [Usitatibacter sp.]|nr:DNA polymerase Y family protein [Usitatibacter sp.]
MLWVALELPSLPLQLVERAGVSREPVVICEGPEQRPVVICANASASSAGVREGQAVAAAKALVGELRVVPRDPAAEREALQGLAAWAGQFTPMACLDGQGIALEIEPSLKLFSGHARLCSAIRRGIRHLGFHAVAGIAPTPLAARLFARAEARGLHVRSCIDLAGLRERVADLPLFLLDWPARTLAHLTDLGVLRMRDMLELPMEGVARRFGPEIAIHLGRLMGTIADPREPYSPPPRFRARLELPAEADGVEALLFPLRRMLAEMEGALRGRGAGVQRLMLWLEHGRKARTRVEMEFASPERESDFILAIAREKLGRLTLPAATLALDLRAEALLPYMPRESTWLPGAREQAIGRERLIERLSARLGRDRVFGIAVGDDHRPDRSWSPVQPGHSGVATNPAAPAARPVWLLNRPHRLITRDDIPSHQGELSFIAGPERIESGWWDGAEVRRDYYVAANARGETYWIFREHRGDQGWYLHGVFA